jgi:hypothetical protein
MKIQIVKSATKKVTAFSTCPFYVDEPPPAKK